MKLTWTLFKYLWVSLFIVLPIYGQSYLEPRITVNLDSSHTHVAPSSSFYMIVTLDLEEGWHTYWKNPGQVGKAPSISWQLPPGVYADPLTFPVPERIETPPFISFGYHDRVSFPIHFKVDNLAEVRAEKQRIKAIFKGFLCKEVCIPFEKSIEQYINISEESKINQYNKNLVFEALNHTPNNLHSGFSAQIHKDTIELRLDNPIHVVSFIPFSNRGYDFTKKIQVNNQMTIISIPIIVKEWNSKEKRLHGVLSYKDKQGALKGFSIDRLLSEEVPSIKPSILILVLLAFIGGLLLNLMPCVLPIIALKGLSIIDKKPSHRWRDLMALSFGLLGSMWIIVFTLFLLKQGGMALGWGFQLQNPYFVLFLILVFLVGGVSFLGFFESGLFLTRLQQGPSNKNPILQEIISGALITVVATPCSAPFLGVSVGVALSQSLPQMMLVFSALGLGILMPYIVFYSIPNSHRIIPKPGPWLIRFKQIMGFLLCASSLWLIYVLMLQVTASSFTRILILIIILVITLFFYGKYQIKGNKKTWLFWCFIICILGAIISMVFAISYQDSKIDRPVLDSEYNHGIAWESYRLDLVRQLRLENKAYFINFTAAWCITCQTNKVTTFRNKDIKDLFESRGIVPIKADWTNRDDAITKALSIYDRASVPLYIYNKGGGAKDQVLNTLLSPNYLKSIIED